MLRLKPVSRSALRICQAWSPVTRILPAEYGAMGRRMASTVSHENAQEKRMRSVIDQSMFPGYPQNKSWGKSMGASDFNVSGNQFFAVHCSAS